jgi:hypothetical protein
VFPFSGRLGISADHERTLMVKFDLDPRSGPSRIVLGSARLPIKPSNDNSRTLLRSLSIFSVKEAEYRIAGGGFFKSAASFAFGIPQANPVLSPHFGAVEMASLY